MVIGITSNAKQVSIAIGKVSKKIELEVQRAVKTTVIEGVGIARQLAPINSGALSAGITGTFNKRQGKIISAVPKPFPYHFWVNREPGFQTIVGMPPYFKAGQKVAYGAAVESPKGRPIRWTGQPAYFTKTFKQVATLFRNRINRAVQTAIKG